MGRPAYQRIIGGPLEYRFTLHRFYPPSRAVLNAPASNALTRGAAYSLLVLTPLGQGCRMVITGDMSQVDLPTNQTSGLADATARLRDVKGIGIMHLSGADVVRHPVVARILKAYDSDQ